jgi:hypothetical protein
MARKTKKVEEKAIKPRGYDDTFEMSMAELADLGAHIRADMVNAEQSKDIWQQERLKDVRAYFGIRKSSDWPFKGAAKVSSQLHRIMVDTMAANLIASLNAPDQPIRVSPDNVESIEEAKYISDLHNMAALEEYKLEDVMDRALHNALIESFVVLKPVYECRKTEVKKLVTRWIPKGYGVADVTYDMDTDTVVDTQGNVLPSISSGYNGSTDEELQSAGLQECEFDVTKEQILKDGITLYSIGGSHIYVPIWAPGETPFEKYQNSPYVIHQEFPTIQEMEILAEQGRIKNFNLLRTSFSENISSEQLKDEKYVQSGSDLLSKIDRAVVENLWWYGKFKYKGKFRELVVLYNRDTGVILKVQVNEFGIRPFFPIVPFPIDETPFGESLPKKIRPLVTEIELAINTVLNMGMIKAYPPKFFDPSSGFDPKTLGNFGPNSYIPVRDPGRNVFMPPMPEDPRILMEMIKLLMDLVERATGNSDAVQGQISPTANTTAFEVQQALVRSGVRFDIIFKRIKNQLDPMFPYIHALLKRFMPYEKEIRLMGEKGLTDGVSTLYTLSRDQMNGKYSFTLAGQSITREANELQKAMQLYQTFSQDPYISYKPESAYYLRRMLVQHFSPLGVDKILPRPEEVEQILRDRQQVQNEQDALAAMMAEGGMPNVGTPQELPSGQEQGPPAGGA